MTTKKKVKIGRFTVVDGFENPLNPNMLLSPGVWELLFFDEADALFGKPTEVKDSQASGSDSLRPTRDTSWLFASIASAQEKAKVRRVKRQRWRFHVANSVGTAVCTSLPGREVYTIEYKFTSPAQPVRGELYVYRTVAEGGHTICLLWDEVRGLAAGHLPPKGHDHETT